MEEVPRANELYGKIMFGWLIAGMVVVLTGVLLMFLENQNFSQTELYIIVGFSLLLTLSIYLPGNLKATGTKIAEVISYFFALYLVGVFVLSPTVALGFMVVGMLSLLFPHVWRKKLVKNGLARRGYDVQPLS